MKRKLFIFLLMGFISFIKTSAQPHADPRVNLLDMTNLEFINAGDPSNSFAHKVITKSPILLKDSTHYTLMVDELYFERDLQDPTFNEWSFTDGLISESPLRYVSEEKGNWLYMTFFMIGTDLIADRFIVNNYEEDNPDYPFKMMLYEGVIGDFLGYYSYGCDFEVEEGYLYVDVDNQPLEEDVIMMVMVSDNVSASIQVTDSTYQANHSLGDYQTNFMATDSSHNLSFYRLHIKVIDITPPTITGQNTYEIGNYLNTFSESNIRSSLTILDNYDTLTHDDLIITQDTYSGKEKIPGTYHITYKLSDLSENTTLFPITITISDNTAPVIKGPKVIYRNVNEGNITEAELIAKYTSLDDVDGERPVYVVSDNQDGLPGRKEVILFSKDNSGNTRSFSVIVVLIDNEAPTFTTDPLILNYHDLQAMSEEQLKAWIRSKLTDVTHVEIIHNEALYAKKGNIYFSYQQQGKLYYGMITVQPSYNYTPSIIVGILILMNGVFLWVYFKKKHI